MNRAEFKGHDVFQHTSEDVTCIWVDGHWFVPLDVGGEGYECVLDHHTALAAQEGERGGAAVAAREHDAKVLMDFAQWVSTHRAHNGSDHRHGQSLYNEGINGVLPVWASEWLDER